MINRQKIIQLLRDTSLSIRELAEKTDCSRREINKIYLEEKESLPSRGRGRKKKKPYMLTCRKCGTEFKSAKKRTYCSVNCVDRTEGVRAKAIELLKNENNLIATIAEQLDRSQQRIRQIYDEEKERRNLPHRKHKPKRREFSKCRNCGAEYKGNKKYCSRKCYIDFFKKSYSNELVIDRPLTKMAEKLGITDICLRNRLTRIYGWKSEDFEKIDGRRKGNCYPIIARKISIN